MKKWRHALGIFMDRVGFVMGSAPDQFPIEDYLPAEKQMNLERAFETLRAEFLDFAEVYGESPETAECRLAMEESFEGFKKGEALAAKQRLNKLYHLLMTLSK